MTIDIREPLPGELPAYYRALPFGNGLPSWEPAPAAWHGGPEPWPPMRTPATVEQLHLWAQADALDADFHPVAAFDKNTVVGASAMLSMHVTVPGGRPLPIGAVTGTGVLATHRRRGVLRRMMRLMFNGALERGEPLSLLSASEGTIYGRFGFHPATHRMRWEILRSDAQLRPAPADSGALELVDAATAREHWPAVHAVVRAARIGELSAQPGRWEGLSDESDGTNGPVRYLVHRDRAGTVDGVANFRLPWSSHLDHAGTLIVEALEATTSEAYRALWSLLLDFDLTRTVVSAGRPRDEPLRWMLANPRAMRITRQSDNLWARILDIPAAMEARRYEVPGTISFAVDDDAIHPENNRIWLLETDGSSATCRPTLSAPEVTLDLAALSALYLGGMSAADLAFAGRIRPHNPTALQRLAGILRTTAEPHNSFGF